MKSTELYFTSASVSRVKLDYEKCGVRPDGRQIREVALAHPCVATIHRSGSARPDPYLLGQRLSDHQLSLLIGDRPTGTGRGASTSLRTGRPEPGPPPAVRIPRHQQDGGPSVTAHPQRMPARSAQALLTPGTPYAASTPKAVALGSQHSQSKLSGLRYLS